MQLSGSVGKKGKNHKEDIVLVQQMINRAIRSPFRLLSVDGIIGSITITAIEDFQSQVVGFKRPDGLVEPRGKTWGHLNLYMHKQATIPTNRFMGHAKIKEAPANSNTRSLKFPNSMTYLLKPNTITIAWGKKVSEPFKKKVIKISNRLGISPDYLMSCMAFETGETFSPSIKNAAGSGATGLIQFMPATAKGMGTTVESLAKMSAESQLDYVEKYFSPYKGKLKTLEDIYMAILYPAAIGKSASDPLFKKGRKTYEQNSGFDSNQDGIITPAEISVKVRDKFNKGLKNGYLG